MSRIGVKFRELADRNSVAYIPYVCAGDPDSAFTVDLLVTLDRAGADMFEIGIPFSDPIADGPVIQGAMQRSLAGGFKPDQIFEVLSAVRRKGIDKPITIMSYFNPIFKYGIENFCQDLAAAGGDGLLVVDLPPDESSELDDVVRENGIDIIRLLTPYTDDARLDFILKRSSGFAYLVSVHGTTGIRHDLPDSAKAMLGKISSITPVPVALGFGISEPDQIRAAVAHGVSGVIEGSKLITLYSNLLPDRSAALASVEKHASEMKSATSSE